MKKCPYCELPEIKERMIAENDLAWAFATNIPITPGHTLVVPKRCEALYENLSHEEKAAIEDLRTRITASLKKTFGAEGFNFAWNDGEMAGQSVPHFHLHIVPRKTGDAGVYEYEPRKFLYRPGERTASPEQELVAIRDLIRKNLK